MTLTHKKFLFIHTIMQFNYGQAWNFIAVYASPDAKNMKVLWEDLKSISRIMQGPWLIAGDFNDITYDYEKRGGAPVSQNRCNKFKNMIEKCGLLDLGAIGSKYTWRDPIYNGGQQIFERLNRALGNDTWKLQYPKEYVKVLPRLEFSNHHPLLICPIQSFEEEASNLFGLRVLG